MNCIKNTTALCPDCRQSYPATIFEDQGQIQGKVDCPVHPRTHLLSSDADLYKKLRFRSATNLNAPPSNNLTFLLNYVSITNACNLACSICAANATSIKNGTFLSVDEICRRASVIKVSGNRILHLFGGEPTIHPDLLAIVKRLSDMDMQVGIVSNGVRLGEEPDLARKLKENGAARLCLQFDSLDKQTLKGFNRQRLEQKQNAIRHGIDAGLKIGLNSTMTVHNLHEAADLLAHGLELGPAVSNMTFGVSAKIGRFTYQDDAHIDREMVIKSLISGSSAYELTEEDFIPLPSYLPWRLQVHPDCGVHVPFLRAPWGIRPLNHYIDLQAFYKRLSTSQLKPGFITTKVLPALMAIRHIRSGKRIQTARALSGLLSKSRDYSLVNVAITNYRAAAFLDEERLNRCASAFHSSEGPVKGCLHFFMPDQVPGSI